MRDQYAGDVSDYLKFAFLSQVTTPSDALGVAWWYLDGHDGRADGRHDEYLDDPTWAALDPVLFAKLARRPARSVAALETLDIWPAPTVFHREPVPGRSGRAAWAEALEAAMADASIVFVDPDNGVSRPEVVTPKSATEDEVRALAANGRCALLIRFPDRTAKHP